MLIEQPESFKHFAGMDVIVVEALIDRWTVISKLHHLSTKVRTLIDPHSMRPLMLEMKKKIFIYTKSTILI